MVYRSRQRLAGVAGWGVVLCTVVISGCAHRAGATIRDDTTVISGHNTVHASPSTAMRTVLVEAAAITVDHGYRYFRLITPVRPGADVTIRLYGKGDVGPQMPSVYDADAIAAGQIPGAPSRISP